MSFDTTYENPIVLNNEFNVVFGTAMLGTTYGEVISCGVKRTADKIEIEGNNGNLLACILKNPRFEASFEILFPADTEAAVPSLGAQIDFPLAEIAGNVLECEVKWANSAGRMLSITATHWDSIGEVTAKQIGAEGTPESMA
jgi:hypothetical protein